MGNRCIVDQLLILFESVADRFFRIRVRKNFAFLRQIVPVVVKLYEAVAGVHNIAVLSECAAVLQENVPPIAS